MGREAIRWNFTGYLIHGDHGFPGNVLTQVAALIGALEADDAGILVHPQIGSMLVMCERYSYSDKRERGGYFEFDMQFIEAGSPATQGAGDAQGNLTDQAGAAENQGVSGINNATTGLSGASGTVAPGGGISGTIPP
jgi:prophage DNA circulation protein